MKKYIIIICLLLSLHGWAQTSSERGFQKEAFLSQFNTYFSNAEVSENGVLYLTAKDSYSSLSENMKKAIISSVFSKRHQAFVSVSCGYKRELWQMNFVSNTAFLLDSWDLNSLEAPKTILKTLQKTDAHPWFLFFGLSGTYNSDMLNVNAATRVGFFLLKNYWDLALSCSMGMFGGLSDDDSVNALVDLGIMSKVYFPIKKLKVSPYIGAGVSYVCSFNNVMNNEISEFDFSSNSYSWNYPIYIGINWFVGPGSLDFGVQFNENNPIFMIGYTFSPNKLFKK